MRIRQGSASLVTMVQTADLRQLFDKRFDLPRSMRPRASATTYVYLKRATLQKQRYFNSFEFLARRRFGDGPACPDLPVPIAPAGGAS
jgi:hypothetical protein